MRLVNLLINTLLKLDKIKLMCYIRYIVTSLHRYIVTSLHRYRYHLLINLITPPAHSFHGGSKRAATLYCLKHSFLRQLSFLSLLSFPRRRESTHAYCLKSLFSQRGKPSSKAQTCGLLQSVSPMGFPHCIKSELVLSMVSLSAMEHICHYMCSFLFFCQKLFLRSLSFLRQPSFLRRQESRMYFVSLTAIKLWVQGVCQKKHPLGARRRESRKYFLFQKSTSSNGVKGNFFVGPFISLYRGWQVKTLKLKAYAYGFLHKAERIIRLLLLCAYRGKTKSKAQTCVLLQSVSFQLPHCIKSELVLNWFFPLYQRNSLLSDINRGCKL